MIDAFEKGGCFHSRTAMGMYKYIRDAVDAGSVLLEWDHSKVFYFLVEHISFNFNLLSLGCSHFPACEGQVW